MKNFASMLKFYATFIKNTLANTKIQKTVVGESQAQLGLK